MPLMPASWVVLAGARVGVQDWPGLRTLWNTEFLKGNNNSAYLLESLWRTSKETCKKLKTSAINSEFLNLLSLTKPFLVCHHKQSFSSSGVALSVLSTGCLLDYLFINWFLKQFLLFSPQKHNLVLGFLSPPPPFPERSSLPLVWAATSFIQSLSIYPYAKFLFTSTHPS